MSTPPSASMAGKMKTSTVASTASVKSAGTSRLYDVPSLEDDGTNYQMWKFRVRMVLGVRGLWKVVTGDEAQPDEVTHPVEHEDWLSRDREALAQITLTLKDEPLSGVLYTTTSADAWKKLSERYEGKGKQSIAYLISELFRNTLSDDESMETQLNSMRQKANVLKTLGQPLEESLVAIAMVISLPPTYSTLRTILMAADDKLTTDAVINQVLIEEKSRKASSTHSALAAKMTGRSKQKGKGKVSKEDKGKKSCTYCSKSGHTEDECWAKRAAERSSEKDDTSKEQADEKELAARIAKTGSTHLPPLRLFLARQTGIPIQRDRVVDSTASAHTMCHERDLFDSHHPLWPPHLTNPGDGRTVSAIRMGDSLDQAPIPPIAGDRTPRETFAKNGLPVRKLEHGAPGDISNVNRPGDDSITPSRRPATASTNGPNQMVQPQLNKPKSNGFDGESRRLAIASTNSLSHITVDGIYPNAEETGGLACGTGQRSIKGHSNSPGGLSAVETPGSLGAQLPSCCTLGPARDPPRLAARSIASCPTRSCSHSCECIRGCSAPDHSHERSQDSTRSSPYRLAPDSTHPLARASVFVAAVRPITRTSVVETRLARSLAQVYSRLLCARSLTQV